MLKIKKPSLNLFIALVFLSNLFSCPYAVAEDVPLPAPGVMVHLSPEFNPPILKGLKVYPDNPFRLDFILDKGDSPKQEQLKTEATKLIKYFLASLTIPERDLWVNLSPYEKDRIIPNSFGLTEMGRDLLAEDYMLKQITASLIYPEDTVGKRFWKKIYEEAARKYGTTNIPINTFNKVWIVPQKAVVYENVKAGTAYVVESKLKVMLEQDYLALEKNAVILSAAKDLKIPLDSSATPQNDVNALGSQIVREIVIPELTKEVNENKNFAHLRQVYNSLILATWYKKKIKDSVLSQVYAGQNKTAGVNINDPQEKERIYQRYLQAFKKGVYNYIKEEPDPLTQETVPRKYFSGGVNYTNLGNMAMTVVESMDSAQTVVLEKDHLERIETDIFPTKRVQNKEDIEKKTETEMWSRAQRLLKEILNTYDNIYQEELERKTEKWAEFNHPFMNTTNSFKNALSILNEYYARTGGYTTKHVLEMYGTLESDLIIWGALLDKTYDYQQKDYLLQWAKGNVTQFNILDKEQQTDSLKRLNEVAVSLLNDFFTPQMADGFKRVREVYLRNYTPLLEAIGYLKNKVEANLAMAAKDSIDAKQVSQGVINVTNGKFVKIGGQVLPALLVARALLAIDDSRRMEHEPWDKINNFSLFLKLSDEHEKLLKPLLDKLVKDLPLELALTEKIYTEEGLKGYGVLLNRKDKEGNARFIWGVGHWTSNMCDKIYTAQEGATIDLDQAMNAVSGKSPLERLGLTPEKVKAMSIQTEPEAKKAQDAPGANQLLDLLFHNPLVLASKVTIILTDTGLSVDLDRVEAQQVGSKIGVVKPTSNVIGYSAKTGTIIHFSNNRTITVRKNYQNNQIEVVGTGWNGNWMDIVEKVRRGLGLDTTNEAMNAIESSNHITLFPDGDDTRVVMVFPKQLILNPKTSKLIETIKAKTQDFAMTDDKNGHSRLTFKVKEKMENVRASLNFMPWERHASRILLAGTILLTPVALFSSVPERIVATVDTVLLAVILILELIDRQAKRFMSDHEYYLKVLRSFYEKGGFTNGHTSREVIEFYMNYYKDFVDNLDDDQEIKTLKLLAGVLTKEEVDILRKKKKKVKFEQRLEWALDELAIGKDEFTKVHETYLNAFRDANKGQRKLQTKVIATALIFYNQNDSDFKNFLTKEQQDEIAQLLAAQLSETAKRRIVSLGQEQPTAIQKLMYWDLEYKMAEEGEKPALKTPSLESAPKNPAMINAGPQAFDMKQAEGYFAQHMYQPDKANKSFPGIIRMNTQTGKLLMVISPEPYGNGVDHNTLLKGTLYQQNTASGNSEWILMKWEYGEDGKLKHLSFAPPLVPKKGYSTLMKFFLRLTTDHSSNEEYQRQIHDEIIIIAGLIKNVATDPENIEVITSLTTMRELANLNQNLSVLAELPTYNDRPDELSDLDALLAYLRSKEDFIKGSFIESGDIPVSVKNGIHQRVGVPLVKLANLYREQGIQIELIEKRSGLKERAFNMNSILEISIAAIKDGDVRLRIFSADEQKVREIEAKVKAILNPAMASEREGGIDLNTVKNSLQIQNQDEGIKFRLDSAILQQLQNVPGFTPVIINIQPMTDLCAFLGLIPQVRA